MINVQVNEKELVLSIEKFTEAPLLDATDLRQITDRVKLFILLRTQGGKDVEGRMFHKYSETHKFFREEKGFQTSHVDLNMSGQMQASISGSVDVQAQQAIIGFSDIQQASKAHGLHFGSTHAWGRNPKVILPARHFFDVSEAEMETITKEVEKMVDDKIKKAGLQ